MKLRINKKRRVNVWKKNERFCHSKCKYLFLNLLNGVRCVKFLEELEKRKIEIDGELIAKARRCKKCVKATWDYKFKKIKINQQDEEN